MADDVQTQNGAAAPGAGASNGASNGASGFDFDSLRREYPTLGRYKDPGAMAKGFVELEKRLSTSLRLPGEYSTPEEWDKFYSRIGRPESADKYQFEIPDGLGDEKLVGSFREVAHQLGLTQKQVEGLAGWWGSQGQGIQAGTAEQMAAWDKELRTELGHDHDRVVNLAQRTFATIVEGNGNHPLVTLMNATGLGNHPTLIKLMARLGETMREDEFITGEHGPVPRDNTDLKARAAEIRMSEAFLRANHPGHAEAVREHNELYRAMYPEPGDE